MVDTVDRVTPDFIECVHVSPRWRVVSVSERSWIESEASCEASCERSRDSGESESYSSSSSSSRDSLPFSMSSRDWSHDSDNSVARLLTLANVIRDSS